MRNNRRILLLFLMITCCISAQIKGVVKDSLTDKPISFVNIAVQNENIGVSSEENGEFLVPIHDKNKKLIFTAIGYEKKIVKASMAETVVLKPKEYELKEVVIIAKFETKHREIGDTDSPIRQAFENGPKIDTKFFPYNKSYKKTKFIQKVVVLTDCKIENASIKIHFYRVDNQGFPSEEMLQKDFIVLIKQGINKHYFDLSDYNLVFPKSGIFIGFEKLIIAKNKVEKTIFDSNTNETKTTISFAPMILYNVVERESSFSFYGGKWHKEAANPKEKITVNEPFINLILSN
jgi:hypothetical protein